MRIQRLREALLPFVRLSLFLILTASLAVPAGAKEPSAKVDQSPDSVVGNDLNWQGRRWTKEDVALFGGVPKDVKKRKNLILVRYSFFSSNYDTSTFCPMWVAHVDQKETDSRKGGRVGEEWKRPSGFYPDANIVKFSDRKGLPHVVQDSYTGANPPSFGEGSKGYQKLTRGHCASNQEMKCQGTDAEGKVSQYESFSLANVVPQTQHNNAPLWAKLETNCGEWAAKLGDVAVITGPIFLPQKGEPIPIGEQIYTKGKAPPQIPVPTHLFKVIIGNINGKRAAVGFLVPHRSDLGSQDLGKFVVPVRLIERATGINFMPDLGKNDGLEAAKDDRWMALLSRPVIKKAPRWKAS